MTPPSVPPRPSSPSDSEYLSFHLIVSADTAGITRTRRDLDARYPTTLQQVRMTGATWKRFPVGTEELILSLHDAEGNLLRAYGQSARPLAFGEVDDARSSPSTSDESKGPLVDRRPMTIPLEDSAVFLALRRTTLHRDDAPEGFHELAREEERVLSLGAETIYLLPNAAVSLPEVEMGFASPVPGFDRPLPIDPDEIWPFPAGEVEAAAPPSGHIVSHETLWAGGDPAQSYNIVLVGDGFTERELGVFDEYAGEFASALLEMEPFDRHKERVNVFAVRAASIDSGITGCPAGTGTKRTFFNVHGSWQQEKDDETRDTFLGTSQPETIYTAAEHFAPREQLDLFVVIANCEVYGGSAFPRQRMAFATLERSKSQFVNIAAHECGHAIAELAEEYISGLPWDPLFEHPNVVRREDAEDAWWKELADPKTELNPEGTFRVRYDDVKEASHNARKLDDREDFEKLGLFWGCQFVDTERSMAHAEGVDPLADPRGQDFFRPMARCKMRNPAWPFCRVCAHAIERILRAKTG